MSEIELTGEIEIGTSEEQAYARTNSRIDNIIAHNNDTEGNTELLDIRTGENGITYSSAGSAVREQFKELYKTLDGARYISLSSGAWVSNSNDRQTDSTDTYLSSIVKIPIDDKKLFLHVDFADISDYQRIDIYYYDSSGSYLGTSGGTGDGWNIIRTKPNGAAFFTVKLTFASGQASPTKINSCMNYGFEYASQSSYMSGYIRASDHKFLQGFDRNYKVLVRKVKKGDIVHSNKKTNSTGTLPMTFFDSNGEEIYSLPASDKFTEFCGVALADGYVVSCISAAEQNGHELLVGSVWKSDKTCDLSYNGYFKDGAFASSTSYKTSTSIALKKGDNIVVKSVSPSTVDVITALKGTVSYVAGVDGDNDYWYAYYATDDCVVRLCTKSENVSDFSFEVTHPLEELNGKKICAIGDSYFDGNVLGGSRAYARNHVWINLLALRNNMTLQNYGKNGCTLANYSGAETQPSSLDTLSPVCFRCELLDENENYDFIIFEGGRNDFNQNVPVGTYGSASNDDFYGALRNIIFKLIEKFPEAQIWGHPCWSFDSPANDISVYQQQYKDAFITCCENMGVQLFDVRHNGITARSAPFRTKYFMSETDISHFNAKGHERYVKWIEKHFR